MGMFADPGIFKQKYLKSILKSELKKKKSSAVRTVATSCSFCLCREEKRGLYFASAGTDLQQRLQETFSGPAGIPLG